MSNIGGCFKNNTFQIYRQAIPQEEVNFQNLEMEIREARDPYVVAIKLSDNNSPFEYQQNEFPKLIQWAFQFGFGGFVFAFTLNIIFKANRCPSANFGRTRINSVLQLKER
ncbi:hypothetical protein IMG5_205800 [Ichthyophthirius multifiliis]|uniref:Uncharacterized protein n=1 Tax=Ichthyophthirius multifiliis TaxID=5932 RepID=G0R6L1_ICHMU|nr:hypothetical protein IMG5_205800 [Ichthyophthirius multifiliis]EGR26900.1 hypothetical protein IMG5_205800 [Ichthyophthirius multifiliis]|eukprot:XP_004023784.1 hypothetical protein IMG5_205800 [Ichthyophthirius multifiliis]